MLTDAQIQRALKAGKNCQISDGKGKGTGRLLLVIRGRTAEWYAQQWLRKTRRLSKIGSYPQTSLAMARAKFAELYEPAIQNKADIRAAKSQRPGSVRELFDGYILDLKNRGKRSVVDAEYNLQRALESLEGDRPANEIKTADVTRFLRPIYNRGSRSMADHMRGYIHSAFAWGIKTEKDYRTETPQRFHLAENPAAFIPTEPKTPGTRWLTVEELREFWAWLHIREPHNPNKHHAMHASNQRAIRLVILTGQRVEMIAGVHSSMIVNGCIEWSKTKNGTAHALPLPPQACRELIEPNRHGWFFPMITRPEEHVRDTVLYSITRRFVARAGCEPFSPRDLRRTWKTLAGQAGISKERRDLLQHHARSDVSSRHYDRYEYLAEKHEAMAHWSEWFADKIEKPLK